MRDQVKSAARSGDRWQQVARLAWLLVAILGLILLVPDVPDTLALVRHLCTASTLLDCSNSQITAPAARALERAGVALDVYAAYMVGLQLFTIAVAYVVGIALMVRRSPDRMVLVAAFACLAVGNLQAPPGFWGEATAIFSLAGNFMVGLFFFLFPSGRFVPRWSLVLFSAYLAAHFVNSNAGWAVALYAVSTVSIIGLQVYRYHWISTPVQRQQTKLVILGIGTYIAIFVIALVVYMGDAGLARQPIAYLLLATVTELAPLPILLSIGLAILRYRLWDVDVLINRSLVYGTLTVSLAALYVGCVIGLEALSRLISGQQSQLAVAVSTLLIAALFNPLRHRIQGLIARTFYRRKYDATHVLAQFGDTCKDQTDLEQLQAGLLQVVDETMRPRHVALWLAQPGTVDNVNGGWI
ncbi:MAG TPA: hypothetical protein VFB58_15590 [Chloroflexota bacterium]|nr:hypothetical protein [Chloroflexota bacterium]